MSHAVIIDIVTIVVMCVTAFYAARLNRALMRARDGRSELAQLIASLTTAHKNAENAIRGMKATAAEYDSALQKQIVVSRGLIDELGLINESSNALANRLERLAPLARGGYEGGGTSPYRPATLEEKSITTGPLRADRSERPVSTGAPAPAKPAQAAKPAYAAQPAAERKQAPTTKPAAPAAAKGDSKSRAEEELFAAIETLRKGRQP
jgi:hypothetical protein